jgi:hypothetical protein
MKLTEQFIMGIYLKDMDLEIEIYVGLYTIQGIEELIIYLFQ